MKTKGRSLFRVGLKRRKKEVRRMRVMMCIAVFFLAFPFLFQDNMNGYQMDLNYSIFGQWFACSEYSKLGSHPYLTEKGFIFRGSKVYSLTETIWDDGSAPRAGEEPPETVNTSLRYPSRESFSFIGALSPGMAERNGIELIDGRFPENDGEVAMESSVLDALGLSHELGSEVSFYISKFDDYPMLQQLYGEYIESLGKDPEEAAEKEDDGVHYNYDLDDIPGRNEMYRVRFKLVGTIQRYTNRWNTEMTVGTTADVSTVDPMNMHTWESLMADAGTADLPGVIVSQEQYDKLQMSKRTYRFFEIKPEYASEVWRIAGKLMVGILSSDYSNKPIVLNRFAYENPLWGNVTMYRSITILLILISTCIIAYLMANYLGKRRQFFLRMREIGASTRDVWKMAAYECVWSVLPVAALTLVAAYALSLLVVYLAAKGLGIEFFYVFSFRTLLTILAAVGLTLAVSLLAALMLFGGRSLVAKNKSLSRSAVQRLKSRAERKQHSARKLHTKAAPQETDEAPLATEKAASKAPQRRPKLYLGLLETLKRDRLSHRFKNRMLTVISLIVCSILIFCAAKVYEPAKAYFEVTKNDTDFSAERTMLPRNVSINVPITPFWDGHMWNYYQRATWTKEVFSSNAFFPESMKEKIDSMLGVLEIDWRCSDFTHKIAFDGKEEDPFFQDYLLTYVTNNQPFSGCYELDLTQSNAAAFLKVMESDFYGIYVKEKAEEYWERFEAYLDPEVADYNAFYRGKQVIAVVDTQMTRALQWRPVGLDFEFEEGFEDDSPALSEETSEDGTWCGYSPSFKAGDTLYIECEDNVEVPVTIAAVVPLSESGLGPEDERFLTLFGADRLMQRVFSAFDEWGDYVDSPRYNAFDADLDAVSANEYLVKDLVNLCATYNVRFHNYIAEKEESRTAFVNVAVTYGFFGLMLAVLFFFVTSCIAKDEEIRLGEKYRILHRFGLTVRQMRIDKLWDGLRRTLPLLLAFPLQMLLQFVANLETNLENIQNWATFYASVKHPSFDPANDVTPFVYTLKTLWNCVNPELTLIILGVFMLGYWLIISRMDKEWRKAL